MAKSKKQKELDEELLSECQGYYEHEDKPDGAYIKKNKTFFNLNKIKSLIEAGADVNSKNSQGRSPLHWAADRDNVAVAKLLISAGADVNAKNRWGDSPLDCVNSATIANYLIKAGAKRKSRYTGSVRRAFAQGNIVLVKLLLSAKFDAVQDDEEEHPWLHWAVESKNVADLNILIELGVDVNSKDDEGKTPLHRAVKKASKPDLTFILISAGADVNAKDNKGNTPLFYAKSEEIKDLLKEHGAN